MNQDVRFRPAEPLAPAAPRQRVVGATRWDKVREGEGFQAGDRNSGKKRRDQPGTEIRDEPLF